MDNNETILNPNFFLFQLFSYPVKSPLNGVPIEEGEGYVLFVNVIFLCQS